MDVRCPQYFNNNFVFNKGICAGLPVLPKKKKQTQPQMAIGTAAKIQI